MCTVLKSSVYYTSQNIIHLYLFLVQITEFLFVRIAHSKVDSIICTPPPVWRASSFLRIFCTNCWIIFIFNFWNFPALILKLHQLLSSLLFLFFPFLQMKLINRANPCKSYVRSLWFWKMVAKRPITQISMVYLRRSYVINYFQIFKTSKVLDIQRISLWLIHHRNQLLNVASHQGGYYIYIYSEKIRFINIHIGEQSQQGNVTPDSIQLRTCSSWYQKINFHSWLRFLPTPLSSPGDDSIVSSSG